MNNSTHKTKYNGLVYQLGTNDRSIPISVDRKHTREYILWKNMLFRCTKEGQIKNPTYIDCTVSDNFKNYSYFYHWCQVQKGFKDKDENDRFWHLDKDLLVKGNKLYSEDTCVFVPKGINQVLVGCNKPMVKKKSGYAKYRCICNNGRGTCVHLGMFETYDECFEAYKHFKEVLIKKLANQYAEKLDVRVYSALMGYIFTDNHNDINIVVNKEDNDNAKTL